MVANQRGCANPGWLWDSPKQAGCSEGPHRSQTFKAPKCLRFEPQPLYLTAHEAREPPNCSPGEDLSLPHGKRETSGHLGLRLQALLREQVSHWGQGLCESPRTEQRMSPGPSCSQLHDAGSQRHPLSALQPAAEWRVEDVIPRRPQSLEKKTKLQTLTVRCPAGHSPDWSHSIKPQTSSPVSAYRDSSLLFSDSSLDVSGQQGLNRKDRFKTKVQKGIRKRQAYEISKKHSFML